MKKRMSNRNRVCYWVVCLSVSFSLLTFFPNVYVAMALSFTSTLTVWGIVLSSLLRRLDQSLFPGISTRPASWFPRTAFDPSAIMMAAFMFYYLSFGFLSIGIKALAVMVHSFSSENAFVAFFCFIFYGMLFSFVFAYVYGLWLFRKSLAAGLPTKLVVAYCWFSAFCLPVLPLGLYVSFSVNRTLNRLKGAATVVNAGSNKIANHLHTSARHSAKDNMR